MMTNEEYIEEANKIIRTLTKYGVREETHPTWVRKFAWSNASARWWTWYYAYPPNKPITLDANEFVLPNIPNNVARKLCDHFDALPLFRNSFEHVWKKKEAENPIPNVMIELAPLQHVVRVEDTRIDVLDNCYVEPKSLHAQVEEVLNDIDALTKNRLLDIIDTHVEQEDYCDDCGATWGQPHNEEVEH